VKKLVATATALAVWVALADDVAAAPPAASAAPVRIAPSPKGVLGAWLLAGPFRAGQPALEAAPAGVDESSLAPSLGAVVGGERDLGKKRRPAARWVIGSSGPTGSSDPGVQGSRPIDLKASLEDATGSDLVAYAAGRLHVEKAGRYFLFLGVDDGVRVKVDGAVVLSRDVARPLRDDDDVIPLDLAAGDHEVVLKLHQRDGAWAFRAKLVDATLAPPGSSYLALPGTTATDAATLASRMSWVVVDRAFDARATPPRYRPVLTVRYPEGVPRGVSLPVTARFTVGEPSRLEFALDAGGVAVTDAGASDLVIALPPVEPWSGTATLDIDVAGRGVTSLFPARPASEQALVRVERALASLDGSEPWLVPGSLDSVKHLARRLARLVARGDGDSEAQLEEAHEVDRLAADLERRVDPYEGRTGMMRRALVTALDGAPSEFGLYVPPSYKGRSDTRRYPLVIGLHGLNSYPISLMRALFGLDEEKKEPLWKDRHSSSLALPPVDAFVLTPYAHGNAMYRELGEDDVLLLMQWATKVFPIDPTRVTITGPSMGGTGSASLPLHFPHVFAAAEPLCGYHSYLIRGDIAGRPMRPWEHLLLEERSNVLWAENGEHLPLWIVHGTRDLPEANSGVLIERYEKLKYSIKHDHPDVGHNVWGPTYADLKGMKWLLAQRLDPHPAHVRFRTMRTRYGTSAWVTVDELASESGWADVDARVKSRTRITATTSGVAEMTFARDERLVDADGPITVTADGVTLTYATGEPLTMHRSPAGAGPWAKGRAPLPTSTPRKRGHVTGPLRDVFHEPLLFVYGAEEDARVNERVARAFADRPGISASYPVMSDAEFLAKNEPLANDRALFLVGRANRVLAALEAESKTTFPIHVDAGAVTVGKERMEGKELGAAFVHPNPLRTDRYVVVVGGADVLGTLRALSLPDLVPDFVVWDEALGPARGQILLGSASLRAGGFFRNDWSLPAIIADPLAKAHRAARPEREAQPEPTSTDAP
jgi:poly(3-hydroxybutyrate) depolymerase